MKFLCDNCKAKYQIGDDRIAGKAVRMKCRRCGHDIHLSSGPQDTESRPPEASISGNSVIMEAPSPLATPLPTSSPFASRPDLPRARSIRDNDDDESTAIMSSPLLAAKPTESGTAPKAPSFTRGAPAPGAPSPLGKVPVASPAAPRPVASAPAPRPPLGSRPAVNAPTPGASQGAPQAPPRPSFASRPNVTPARPQAKTPAAPPDLVVAPAAPALAEEWYVGINGVPLGPVSVSVVRARALEGAVTPESLVWREGFGAWRPLREVPDLVNVVLGAQEAGSSSPVVVAVPPMMPPVVGASAEPPAPAAAPPVLRASPASPAAPSPGGPRLPSSPGRVTGSMAAAPTAAPALGRVTGSMAAAPTAAPALGRTTSSMAAAPTAAPALGRVTSSMAAAPTAAPALGRVTSSMAAAPTAAPALGRTTSSMAAAPTAAPALGRVTSSMAAAPTAAPAPALGRVTNSMAAAPTAAPALGRVTSSMAAAPTAAPAPALGRVTSSMAAAPTAAPAPALGRVTSSMAAAAIASPPTEPWAEAASAAPWTGTPLETPPEPPREARTAGALLATSAPFDAPLRPLSAVTSGTPLGPFANPANVAPVPTPSAPLDEAPRVLGVLADPFAQPPPAPPPSPPEASLAATPVPRGSAGNLAPPAPLEVEIDAPIHVKRSHGPPVMAYAFVAMAAVFGGVAAYVLFLKQPQVIVVQGPPVPQVPSAVTTEKPAPSAQVEVGEPTTEHSTAPAAPKAPSSTVAGGPRPKGATTGAPAPFDTSGFISTIPGPTSTPPPSQGTGQLSAGEIQGVVTQNQPLVRRKCWQPALDAKSPSAPSNARVMGTIVIGASGNVESSSASGSERDFPGLSSCIASRMKTWKFPPSGSSSPPVQVPFVFAGQ